MHLIVYDMLLLSFVFAVYLTFEPSLTDPIVLTKDFLMLSLYILSCAMRVFIFAPYRCLKKCCCCCLWKKCCSEPEDYSPMQAEAMSNPQPSTSGGIVNMVPFSIDDEAEDDSGMSSVSMHAASTYAGSTTQLTPKAVVPFDGRVRDYFKNERSPIIKAKSSLVMVLVLSILILHASHSVPVVEVVDEPDIQLPLYDKADVHPLILVPGETAYVTTTTTVRVLDHHAWNDDLKDRKK